MKSQTALISVAIVSWIGLSSACQTTGSAPEPQNLPSYDSWAKIMEHEIEDSYANFLVVEATKDPDAMDFDAIARRARRAAHYMALGHGPFEYDDVEGFARFAEEAEQWLRDIAAAADASDGMRTAELIRLGETNHCDRCHEASL